MNRGKGSIMAVLSLMVVVSVLLLAGVSSAAEKFPSREIVIVVTFSAGSSNDLSTRVLAEYLKKELGVPILVEARPEANGIKGVVDVYRAKPDGYTLLSNLVPRNPQMEIVYKTPYKILELTYLGAFQKQYILVAVRKESPYKTMKELFEASKTKPLNCSTPGQGSRSHQNAMILKKRVGIDLVAVPYKGSAPAMMALLSGSVDMTIVDDLVASQHEPKLRFLAIISEERFRKFPDVPTFKELGYEAPLGYSILGICGPPGLPENISKILSDALVKAIKNPEFISKLDKMGPTPIYMPGPQFRAETENFYKIVEAYKDILTEE